MKDKMATIEALCIGKKVRTTAYVKEEKKEVKLAETSLVGDERGYKGHISHASDRVLLHVNSGVYDELRKEFKSEFFVPGGLGENICTDNGITAETVCIGDIYSVGKVRIQVTMPRYPCAKNDKRHSSPGLSKYLLKHTLGGWFYRVITGTEEVIRVGDVITLVERPHPTLMVKYVNDLCFNTRKSEKTKKLLRELYEIPELADELREKIGKKLR